MLRTRECLQVTSTGVTTAGSEVRVAATFISAFQISCVLPAAATSYHVSMTNTGTTKSSVTLLTVYDGSCETCNQVTGYLTQTVGSLFFVLKDSIVL